MKNLIKTVKTASAGALSLLNKDQTNKQNIMANQGDYAETIAMEFLKQQGLNYIERNFNCKAGEIDLIFKDQHNIVFVEVRYRKNKSFGSPAETVNSRKQKKIVRAALTYLQTEKYSAEQTPIRFDVIQLLPAPKSQSIIKGAENTSIDDQEIIFKDYQISWIKSAFTG